MKLEVKDLSGKVCGEYQVRFPIITNGKGTQAVHDTVVAFLAAQRRGTACTKTKGEVSGSGKKPWPQKGTGRARAGMIRSPLWRKGGVVFGPRPRDYSKKVNEKTKLLALRKALSERLLAGDVIVVDQLQVPAPKTKEVLKILGSLDLKDRTVTIVSERERNLTLAARNLPNVLLRTGEGLNAYDVLYPDKLLVTRSALEKIEARLLKQE